MRTKVLPIPWRINWGRNPTSKKIYQIREILSFVIPQKPQRPVTSDSHKLGSLPAPDLPAPGLWVPAPGLWVLGVEPTIHCNLNLSSGHSIPENRQMERRSRSRTHVI
jgi:hypothetical protein